MNQNIDIREVKKYNESLKQYQDAAAQVKAGIEYNKKELERLCGELSQELGISVTSDNIEQVRQEKINEALKTLEVGNSILDRIRKEEAREASASQPVAPPVTPVAPPEAPVTPAQGVAPPVPPQPNLFGFPGATPAAPAAPTVDANGFASVGDIPPMFGNN